MRKIVIKGGYGEHGRNCFLAEYGGKGRCFMIDCGILDTDPALFPRLTESELREVDYLFLTHCHKDHSGALDYAVKNGFSGTLVTSSMTYDLAEITYEDTCLLSGGGEKRENQICLGEIRVHYGRSGHCPGGLWFLLEDQAGSIFFSGDYQAESVFFACDRAEGLKASVAVADCANSQTMLSAGELRKAIVQSVQKELASGRPVIFPVPRYGRGPELFYILKNELPNVKILVDKEFADYTERMLREPVWYRKEALEEWRRGKYLSADSVLQITGEDCGFDILLLADTHLAKRENRRLVLQEAEKGAAVYITGRIKPGGLPEQLLREGRALRFPFPHHQSLRDLETMMRQNYFNVVIPFHNEEQTFLAADSFQ